MEENIHKTGDFKHLNDIEALLIQKWLSSQNSKCRKMQRFQNMKVSCITELEIEMEVK